MRQMKTISLVLISVLLISVFASIVLADETVTVEDSIATETAETTSEVIQEPATPTELIEVSNEVEEIAPSQLASEQRYAGFARATVGDGFAVSSDKTKAELVRALWVSGKYISADQETVKNIRKQYKGQPEKIREELAKLVTDKVVLKATGRLEIGFGPGKEKFKLMKKEFTNTSVSFYLLPINSNLAELKNLSDEEIAGKSTGTLKLDASKYPHLTTWAGTLVLNSGTYAGNWDVSAWSKSKTFAKTNLKKPELREDKEIKELPPGIAKKKPGFFQRLKFWKRAQE